MTKKSPKKSSDVLTLALNKPWFDMIKSGVKTEEYREIKKSYISRFFDMKAILKAFMNAGGPDDRDLAFSNAVDLDIWPLFLKKFNKLVLTCGYPKKTDSKRRLEFNSPKIAIDYGKPEWGAEPKKKYFVITWKED